MEATANLVTELDQAETEPVAWALPLVPSWFGEGWASPDWRDPARPVGAGAGRSTGGYAAAPVVVVLARSRLLGRGVVRPRRAGPGPTGRAAEGGRGRPGRDRGPDRPGGAGAGRVRVRLPASAGEAGDVRFAAGSAGPGRGARPDTDRAGRLRPAPRSPGQPPADHPRPWCDRGQCAPHVQLDRAGRPYPDALRDRPRLPAGHRDVRGRRAPQWHGRRQPPHPRRPRAQPIATAASTGPAGQPVDLLAAPSRPVLPVLRSLRRSHQPGPPGGRGPAGATVRAGDRVCRDHPAG